MSLSRLEVDFMLIKPGPYRTEIWESTPVSSRRAAHIMHGCSMCFVQATHTPRAAARNPKDVALVIAGALEARRPRFRYPVGPFARLNHFLRGKIPSRLLRKATKLYLGLPRAQP